MNCCLSCVRYGVCSNALITRDITRGRKLKTSAQNAHISVCYARIHKLSHSLVYTASVLDIYNFVPLSKRNTLNSSSIRENLFCVKHDVYRFVVITHNPQINKASLEEPDHLLLPHCGHQSVSYCSSQHVQLEL